MLEWNYSSSDFSLFAHSVMLLNVHSYKILTIMFIEFIENFGKVRTEVAREMAGIARHAKLLEIS